MAGLTDEGFENKRLSQILSDLTTDGYNDYDLDTSSSAVVGRLIRLISPSIADCWEAAQEVYDSRNPSTATGVSLDEIVAFSGITRKAESYSTASVMLTGDINTVIDTTRQISNNIGDTFTFTGQTTLDKSSCSAVGIGAYNAVDGAVYTVTALQGSVTEVFTHIATTGQTIDDILQAISAIVNGASANYTASVIDGVLNINRNDEFQLVSYSTTSNLFVSKVSKIATVQADEVGAIAVTKNTLTIITTSISGWDSVYNPTEGVEGEDEESDEGLRERFFISRNATSQNTIDAIYSNLLALDGVASVLVIENDTDDISPSGQDPHSINAIVRGGSSTSIANILWDNKTGGVSLVGDTEVVITDIQGGLQTIKFDRPINVPIYISMTITADDSFEDDGQQQIKDAIKDYFDSSYGVGDDIVYSRLYTPINSVSGFQVDTLALGESASPTGMVNVVIDVGEIGVVVDDNIVITVLTP